MSGYLGNGPGRGQRQAFSFTATASQTAFSGKDSIGLTLTYKPRFIDVYVNGLCIPPSEYTATDGSTITFGFGLNAGDVVYVVAMSAFDVANTLAKDQDGADIHDKAAFLANLGGQLGKLLRLTTYTFSVTWTKQSDTGFIIVEVIGGGGSGARGWGSANQISVGGGGSGGGYSLKKIDAASLGTTESITVGAGGVGTTGSTNGNAGSSTSFGSHCSAAGGAAGLGSAVAATAFVAGVNGGSGSNGDINLRGGPGGAAFGSYASPFLIMSGNGGDGYRGGGGASVASNVAGNSGSGFGAGGGGAAAYGALGPFAGGSGDTGAVIVREYSK